MTLLEIKQYIKDNSKDFIIYRADEMLLEAGDDATKRASAMEEVCKLLLYKSESKRLLYLEKLGNTHKPKKIWEVFMQEAVKKNVVKTVEDSEQKSEQDPQITRVEKFIKNHYEIRYNEVSNQFEYQIIADDEPKWIQLNENTIYRHLQKSFIRYSISDLLSLLKSDFTSVCNPIKEYFQNLEPWDQKTDYIQMLSKYIVLHNPKVDGDRFGRMLKKMFVRSIACGFEVQYNKQAFVFVSEKQNFGKTYFMRWLMPEKLKEYYTENINLDKDSLIALTENFIINMDELSSLTRFEVNSLKSIMSKDLVKVRVPYDRRPSLLRRRCNFVGSTNKTEFLNDETGNTRWICFNITDLNWNYSKEIDINLVWAQAYQLFTSRSFDWNLSLKEIQENEQANVDFMMRTPELELLQRHYSPGDAETNGSFFLTATEVCKKLEEKVDSRIKLNVTQVGKAMTILGFKRLSKRIDGNDFPVKGYYCSFIYDDSPKDESTDNVSIDSGNNKQPPF